MLNEHFPSPKPRKFIVPIFTGIGVSTILVILVQLQMGLAISFTLNAISVLVGGIVGALIEFVRLWLSSIHNNTKIIIDNQHLNNSTTQSALLLNNIVSIGMSCKREEIRNAFFNSISEMSMNTYKQNNIIWAPSEWLALSLYKNLWNEIKENQARLKEGSYAVPCIVWITHCGPIDIWSRQSKDQSLLDGSQLEFQHSGGVIARIIVNQTRDDYDKYKNEIERMRSNGAKVFYIEDGSQHLNPNDTIYDFLSAYVPENSIQIPSGHLTLEWHFDVARRQIHKCGMSYDASIAAQRRAQWDTMMRLVLDQESSSSEPHKHLCSEIPIEILQHLSRDVKTKYDEINSSRKHEAGLSEI